MGYCEGGDLHTKLRSQRGSLLPETRVVEWTIQIAFGLQYLHQHNILHRDLKTQNIFLTRSKMIKLGDLGTILSADRALSINMPAWPMCTHPTTCTPTCIPTCTHAHIHTHLYTLISPKHSFFFPPFLCICVLYRVLYRVLSRHCTRPGRL